jgi:transposase
MFHLHEKMRYYLYPYPTDMRKSFYTLSGIVTNNMRRDVQDGEAFIFINRTLSNMKVLHMETGGLVIYHLKLDAGTFRLPVIDETLNAQPMSWHTLMLMTQSVRKKSKRHRKKGSEKT